MSGLDIRFALNKKERKIITTFNTLSGLWRHAHFQSQSQRLVLISLISCHSCLRLGLKRCHIVSISWVLVNLPFGFKDSSIHMSRTTELHHTRASSRTDSNQTSIWD